MGIRKTLLSALLVALATTSGAADPSDQQLDRELASLQGKWQVILGEYRGRTLVSEADANGTFWVFSGRTYTFINGAFEDVAEIRLGLDRTPKMMDLICPKGRPSALAIYALDGDTLTVCYIHAGGGVHPKAFATSPDSPHVLVKLRRVNTDKP